MEQRICIGIQKLDSNWQNILDQVGIWYEQIDFQSNLLQNYSVLILNEQPTDPQIEELAFYIESGGSILELNDVRVFYLSKNISNKRISTAINTTDHPAFQHIPFADLYSKVYLHHGSDHFDGLIHFKQIVKGIAGFFGVNLPLLQNKARYRRKRFFSPTEKFPSEIASTTSKHELLKLFEAILKELHFNRNLPFLKKWESPQKKPVFCFRIDSDYGDKSSMDALYKLANKYNQSFTWFLHVKAHVSWLKHFHSFKNQEFALHGYSHGTSKSADKTIQNIERGRHLLDEAGFEVKGFCAPYGIWNKALEKALKQFDFNYTSEFTFAYDGFPIQPNEEELPLQIPVHPICTGSLNRIGFTSQDMYNYFDFVMNNKDARFEPVLFYHHPLQVGIESIERILQRVKAENLCTLTFGEFAEFWKDRQLFNIEYYWDGNKIILKNRSTTSKIIQGSRNHLGFDLFSSENSTHSFSESPEFEYSMQYLPEPNQVTEMRKEDLSLLKTSILDWRNRKKL